jgi:hypothetical protein
MSSQESSDKNSLSLLLPYYLDKTFSELYRKIGFEVLWANNRADTERIIMENTPDLALEWQRERFDFPIRDLLRKYEKSTPVILLLNWNGSLPNDTKGIGYAGCANPSNLPEILEQLHKALPDEKKALLTKLRDSVGALKQ